MYRALLRMTIRIVWLVVRLLPVVIRAVLTIVLLMITSAIAMVIGVPEATHRMAEEWAGVAHDVTEEGGFDVISYWFFRGLALLTLLAGWICIALFTVALLDIIGVV